LPSFLKHPAFPIENHNEDEKHHVSELQNANGFLKIFLFQSWMIRSADK